MESKQTSENQIRFQLYSEKCFIKMFELFLNSWSKWYTALIRDSPLVSIYRLRNALAIESWDIISVDDRSTMREFHGRIIISWMRIGFVGQGGIATRYDVVRWGKATSRSRVNLAKAVIKLISYLEDARMYRAGRESGRSRSLVFSLTVLIIRDSPTYPSLFTYRVPIPLYLSSRPFPSPRSDSLALSSGPVSVLLPAIY